MMLWAVFIVSFAAAQKSQFGLVTDAMYVNVILQLVYIAKFFHWENGYFATMDMQGRYFKFHQGMTVQANLNRTKKIKRGPRWFLLVLGMLFLVDLSLYIQLALSRDSEI
jgi:hypothetical protein